MQNKKIVSVWLVVQDGANRGKVVLQKRSLKNKTSVFICQAAWAGKVEAGESLEDAIKRECKEELGEDFADNFDFSKLEFIKKDNLTIGEKTWESYNYFGKISDEAIKMVKVHNEALEDLIFVDKKDLIYPLESGKDPKDNIVLFNDQYKIFKNILEKI